MQVKEGAMLTLSRDAVCRICQSPLLNAWRTGEQLCSECGLSDELFHPHKRWITAGSDPRPAEKIGQPRSKNGGTSTRSTWHAILRLGLKVLAAIAPSAAEELGARRFFTPRRAPRSTAVPAISKLGATSF